METQLPNQRSVIEYRHCNFVGRRGRVGVKLLHPCITYVHTPAHTSTHTQASETLLFGDEVDQPVFYDCLSGSILSEGPGKAPEDLITHHSRGQQEAEGCSLASPLLFLLLRHRSWYLTSYYAGHYFTPGWRRRQIRWSKGVPGWRKSPVAETPRL